MKTAAAGLITLLATANEFVFWEVYTVTLADGTVITWTSGDVASATSPGSTVTGESSVTLTG